MECFSIKYREIASNLVNSERVGHGHLLWRHSRFYESTPEITRRMINNTCVFRCRLYSRSVDMWLTVFEENNGPASFIKMPALLCGFFVGSCFVGFCCQVLLSWMWGMLIASSEKFARASSTLPSELWLWIT